MQVSSATAQDVLSSQNEITDCEGGKKFNFYQLERRRESAHASGRLRQVLESGILGWELGAGGSSDWSRHGSCALNVLDPLVCESTSQMKLKDARESQISISFAQLCQNSPALHLSA